MPATTPSISVVMSVFNNIAFVEQAVASILAQSFGDFEFIIVDDGSTDGSADLLDRLAAQDPRIVVLHQSNQGLIASLNRAIAVARAPLLARMDGDDVALPHRFAAQVAAMADAPGIGVLGTQIACIDPQGRTLPAVSYPLDHAAATANLSKPIFCHPTVLMRTALVRAAGGYRACYRHCEDYDLWYRLIDRCTFANLPESHLHYRQSGSQVSVVNWTQGAYGTAVARLALAERRAGRPDPTEGLSVLPDFDALDGLFGPGAAQTVADQVAPTILYDSPAALRRWSGLLLAHATGPRRDAVALARLAVRLVRNGEVGLAVRVGAALTRPPAATR